MLPLSSSSSFSCRGRFDTVSKHCVEELSWSVTFHNGIPRNRPRVSLCWECHRHLDRSTESTCPGSWDCCWPAFAWRLISNDDVLAAMGADAWTFVCDEWRHWWSRSLPELKHQVCGPRCRFGVLQGPPSFHRDVTPDRNRHLRMKENLKLGEMSEVMDELLKPCVLCPWGHSTHLHRIGCLPFETVLQNYFDHVDLPASRACDRTLSCVRSARRDFVRERHFYDKILNNWLVVPSIAIVRGERLGFSHLRRTRQRH